MKYQESLVKLRENKVPPGLPRFRCGWTNPSIDEVMYQELVNLTISIQPRSTWRSAKEQLYIGYLTHMTSMDHDFNAKMVEQLRPDTRYETCVSSCQSPLSKLCSGVASLDLDVPPGMFNDVGQKPWAEEMYRKLLVKLHTQKQKEQDDKDKQAQKREKILEAAANLSPEDMFKQAVAQTMQDIQKGKSK